MELTDLLNRLFIVVVSLLILTIIAGFVVPYFVDWSQYKDRLEAIASEALGQEVHVAGDFSVRFLPQPRMQFDDVIVGPETSPLIEVGSVEAEFSLAEFLRDHYKVTSLVLQSPRLTLRIGADGRVDNVLRLPEEVRSGTVSVANAQIADGTLRIRDSRSGGGLEVAQFDGNLQMSGLRGPFALQGGFQFNEQFYDGRVTSSALNDAGELQLGGFVQERGLGFSVEMAGLAQMADRMRFEGAAEVKFAVAESENAAGVRGDVVIASELSVDTGLIDVSEFVLLPDENRPATRLTGTAQVHLGTEPRFDAVVRGGVVALAARNALAEDKNHPLEIVNLLNDLPAPFVPSIKGHLGLEVSELNARAFVLRELVTDAESTGDGWVINALTARLPGSTNLSLSGTLQAQDSLPQFTGSVELTSPRLSAFAAQWKKPAQSQALLNATGKLQGRLRLVDGALVFDDGLMAVDGVESRLGVVVGKDGESLSINAALGVHNAVQSQMLASLVPEFGNTNRPPFEAGTFSISAAQIDLWDLPASNVTAQGGWSAEGWHVERFSAAQWGGAEIDVQADITGDGDATGYSGAGNLAFRRADNALLAKALDHLRTPERTAELIKRFMPLGVEFDLSEPLSAGQTLALDITGGAVGVSGEINLSEGVAKLFDAPLTANLQGSAADAEALAAQFDLAGLPLGRAGQPVRLALSANGSLTNSIDVDLAISASGERLQFAGGTIVSDLTRPRGGGRVTFTLADFAPMAGALSAGGVGAGPISGDAEVRFGGGRVSLTDINALAAGAQISGDLVREDTPAGYVFGGSLEVGRIGVSSLAKVLGGSAALAIDGAVWPEGPFSVSNTRQGRGNVRVKADQIAVGRRGAAQNASFEIDWDSRELRIRDFSAELGGGRVGFDVKICCEGAIFERQLNGRATLESVALAALLPERASRSISGVVSTGMQFSGTGASFAEQMGSLTGEGSFSLTELVVDGLEPEAFYTLVDVVDVLEKEETLLDAQVREVLRSGDYTSAGFGGLFTIAGGTVRVSNVVVEGEAARIIGGVSMSLADLSLDGRWTMTPVDQGDGRVPSSGAEVVAQVSGTYPSPDARLDLTSLIEGVKFEAYGREVARLEALKAEQEARAQAAAEQRARLQAEMAAQLEAQRQAEEEARRREAALRAEEEREAERLRLQQQQAVDLLGPAPVN